MKKIQLILSLVLVTVLFTSCDPAFNEDFVIDNQSSHDLVFVWSGSWHYYPNENGQNFDGTYPVAAGKKVTFTFDGGLGCTSHGEIERCARSLFLGDSVSFIVGTDTLTFYASDTLGIDSPYNYDSPRYTYDERSSLMSGCDLEWASLTFRVDDELLGDSQNGK